MTDETAVLEIADKRPKLFWYYALFIFLLGLSLNGIFTHDFINYTELRESDPGREFLMDHHNWSVPTLNNQPYMEKPPLVYWAIALIFKVFGIHDWAARIPGVLFGWGILIFTYLLTKRLYNKKVGIGAVLVLATTAGFLARTHEITSDIGLFFFVSGGAYFLYRAFTGSAWWYAPFYLFALGAFFCKGLVGFVFLGLIFLAWIIWMRQPGAILKARPWFGLPAVLLPIIIWLVQLPGDSLSFYLVNNQLERFFPTETYTLGNVQPFYYYFGPFAEIFAPWVIILLVAIPWLWSQRRASALRFLLCWFLPGLIFLMLSGTKRGLYLVPLLPPFAIMVAAWFSAKAKERWLAVSSVIIGVGVLIVYYAMIPRIQEQESWRIPFKKIESRIGPETKLYGYNSIEALRAAIPFYLGRYYEEVKEESKLEALSRQPNSEIVVVAYLNRKDTSDFQKISKYFPHIWLKTDIVDNTRVIYVFANFPDKTQLTEKQDSIVLPEK